MLYPLDFYSNNTTGWQPFNREVKLNTIHDDEFYIPIKYTDERSSLFWDVTQCKLLFSNRRVGTIIGPIFQDQAIFLECFPIFHCIWDVSFRLHSMQYIVLYTIGPPDLTWAGIISY